MDISNKNLKLPSINLLNLLLIIKLKDKIFLRDLKIFIRKKEILIIKIMLFLNHKIM
jgi:hypothetical protein